MTRNCLLYLLLQLTCLALFSQHRSEFSVTDYDETNGLQSGTITAMLQDSRGYLWFGTTNGLCRYDGYVFKTFRKVNVDSNSLPGNTITKLAEGKDGKIWIGFSRAGLCCYDPATGVFRNYPVAKSGGPSNVAPSITMLYIDSRNQVWAGLLQRGFVKLDKATGKFDRLDIVPDTSTAYSKEFRAVYNSAYSMYEERKDLYWLATHDGLYRYDAIARTVQAVRAKPVGKEEIRDDLFGGITPDKDGFWMGSWAGGLTHYNPRTNEWQNYKFSKRINNIANSNIISDLKVRNEQELWISSLDKGLGIFNKVTHTFFFFSEDPVLSKIIPSNLCGVVMEDSQHNIWLSHMGGLSKIREKEKQFNYVPVKVRKTENGDFYGVDCMLEDRTGRYFFIGTYFADGLHVIDRVTGREDIVPFKIMPKEEKIMDVLAMMQDSKGIIWILTRDYVYQYDLAAKKLIALPQPSLYSERLPSNSFIDIVEDKMGAVWMASNRNGLFRYDPAARTYRHFYNDPSDPNSLPSNVLRSVVTDSRGRVWVGGTRGCFGYFNDSLNRFINPNQNKQGDAPENRVYKLYADREGNIWAGTDAGMFCYDTKGATPELKKVYNADNGLLGESTIYITEDKEGNIWCNTQAAICRIQKGTDVVMTFGKLDGIDKINTAGGLFHFRDGKIGIFNFGGYYVFDPASLRKTTIKVPLRITSFKVDDKERYFEPQMAANKRVEVEPGVNVISFEFSALDFNRPDKQEYAYMLEGFDKDWVMAGPRRYVGYANIPGGDYTFKVKASSTPGSWDTAVASIPIHVRIPFYRTWWFLFGVVIAFGTSLYLFYRGRLSKQQQILMLETKAQLLEKEKTLVMYENLKQHLNPHFLFNSLTSLSSLIRIDQKMAGNFLDRMSKIYRYILKSRDSEVVALSEELKFVQLYIDLQTTRFEKGLQINIQIDEEYHHRKIAPVTLQNLVENAIKHNLVDIETPLVIDLYIEDDYLVVRNNLQKKNFVETSNKQGLANMLSLYNYLCAKPMMVQEDKKYFTVKIPLI